MTKELRDVWSEEAHRPLLAFLCMELNCIQDIRKFMEKPAF